MEPKYAVDTEPFAIYFTLTEGPMLANPSDEGVTIYYKTNKKTSTIVEVNGKQYRSRSGFFHEVTIDELKPNTTYDYTINYLDGRETYNFTTAPKKGSDESFLFSYASDSRSGNGGGERDLGGTNAYIMARIMALNLQKGSRFMQFTGDMVTGYGFDPEGLKLEYTNWKNAVSPYGRYMPVITAMGNHESVFKGFYDGETRKSYLVDNFPFDKVSAEAIYAEEFVNPENGPESEDGGLLDPDEKRENFPSYKENVF